MTVSPNGNEKVAWEKWGILVCVGLYFLLRVWGLATKPINPLFDEGTYLSLMQLSAAGKGEIYRDVIFGHPPAIIWVGSWLWPRVGGSLFALRFLYICFCALGFIPMYVIARRLRGPRAALFTLLLMTTSPGFANWLGRLIFLELPQNVFLYLALWLLVVSRYRPLYLCGAGAIVGFSFLIKQPAIPIIPAITLALWLTQQRERSARKQETENLSEPEDSSPPAPHFLNPLFFFCSALLTLAGVVAWVSRVPHYWEYFVEFNLLSSKTHYPYSMGQHLYELTTGFYALPLQFTFGILGAVGMARQGRNREERFLGLYALVIAFILFAVPPHFSWRFLMPAMPIFSLGVWVWWEEFRARSPKSVLSRRLAQTLLILFSLVHLVSVVLYHTHESVNPPAYQEALHILRESREPLFTLDPVWNAASGKTLPLWKHWGGNVFWRQQEMKTDLSGLRETLAKSQTILLNRETMRWIPPEIETEIHRDFIRVFRYETPSHRHYLEILVRP